VDNQTKDNYLKIYKIVKNNFGLSETSLKKFELNLFEPNIDEKYLKYLDDDLRYRVKVKKEDMGQYDEGWSLFKKYFRDFLCEENLIYPDFLEGIKENNKNKTKLLKLINSYYLANENWRKLIGYEDPCTKYFEEEDLKQDILYYYNDCSGKKFSNQDLELIISLNFSDWFLCSTGETWHSCLSLESSFNGSYWSGLPGTIIDKNRAMLFLTNKNIKEYEDIISYRMLRRTFILLDKMNNFNIVRFFPSGLKIEFIKDYFNNNISWKYIDEDENFVSKHKIELFNFKTGDSCFIFIDKTILEGTKESCTIKTSEVKENGGYFYFNKNNLLKTGSIFRYDLGLHDLIKTDKIITSFRCEEFYCSNCNDTLYEDEIYRNQNNEFYCQTCFDERYIYCNYCGSLLDLEEANFSADEYHYCNDCYEEATTPCSICGQSFSSRSLNERNECYNCKRTITHSTYTPFTTSSSSNDY